MCAERAVPDHLHKQPGHLNHKPVQRDDNQDMSCGFNHQVMVVPESSLPPHTFSVDFGGSLAKLAYVTESNVSGAENERSLHLITFQTKDLESCLRFTRKHIVGLDRGQVTCRATGVGCYKYRENMVASLGVEIEPDCNEMFHAARGLDFLWRHLAQTQLLTEGSDPRDLNFRVPVRDSGLLPCLLVNLGSAMTIIKVDREGHMRDIVGGSAFAGLSFLGLGALLTKAKTFGELVHMASRGNSQNVDLLVGDTAGGTYNMCPATGMVSSFGKAARARASGQEMTFAEEDLASSLLKTIMENLTANCYYAAKLEGLGRVCFCGSFIGANRTVIGLITDKLKEASMYLGLEVKPIFLQHEAYLGAVGALAGLDALGRINGSEG